MAGIRNKSLLPTRRAALTLIGAGALATGAIASALAATDNDEVLTESKVLRDPDVPVAGNPGTATSALSNGRTTIAPIAASSSRSCVRSSRTTARSGW
ncbi:hypothetical protein ACVWWR_002267 [Bradyrhizobium sp. LM3.2]